MTQHGNPLPTTDEAPATMLGWRMVEPRFGSALDPLADRITWRAWRLVAMRPASTLTEAGYSLARGLFRLLAELIGEPRRTVLHVQLMIDPAYPDHTDVAFLVGVLGDDRCDDEVAAVERIIESRFGLRDLPYEVQRVDPAVLIELYDDERHSVIIRQRMVGVDDGEGGEVPVLARWNPTADPWSSAAELMHGQPQRLRLRATALSTELTLADRMELDAALQQAAAMRRRAAERVELAAPAERALVTLGDIAASFGSPVLCGELALISDRSIPSRLSRAVGACFTSETDVLRRAGHAVVASQTVMLGGFDVDVDPPGHLDSLKDGLPLRGGHQPRELRDLWTLTEAPLSWPLPGSRATPGISEAARARMLAPVEFSGATLFGHDAAGTEVRVDDDTLRRHVSIVGRTGCGKTAMMVAQMDDDLAHGRPFLLVDPHQAAADRVIERARLLRRRVIVVDALRPESVRLRFAPELASDGSNLLEVERAVSNFASIIVSHLPSDWAGPRFSLHARAHLLPACAFGLEIAEVVEALADQSKVEDLVSHPAMPKWAKDALLSQFSRTNNDATSVREWVDSKFAPFFTGPARRLLAAPGTGTDIGHELVNGTPVIVSLGGLAEYDNTVLGHVAVSLVLEAIIARGAVPPGAEPVRLYIDEAPRFPGHNLELALTGGRKFGVALFLACQSIQQYERRLSDLVLGAEVQAAFAQTPSSAAELAPVLGVRVAELVSQPDLHAYIKVGRHDTCAVSTPGYAM